MSAPIIENDLHKLLVHLCKEVLTEQRQNDNLQVDYKGVVKLLCIQKGDCFMKSFFKSLIAGILVSVLFAGMSITANAGVEGYWDISYIPTAPSSVSNKSSVVVVDYYSGGYWAYCDSISGANGRSLSITSSSASGMPEILITTTGYADTWKMNGSTTGTVSFLVNAATGYSCDSEGKIHING